MRRSGSSGPLRIHLIPDDRLVTHRVRAAIGERANWSLTTGLTCRVPPQTDVLLLPADRCAECLEETAGVSADGAPTAILAYGPASLLSGCFLRGCDDYLKEPWEGTELEHRLARWIRPLELTMGNVTVRVESDRLVSELGSTGITEGERRVLQLLLRHRGEAIPREAFLYALWGTATRESRLVDVYVSRLRTRLREVLPASAGGNLVRSIRGFGYTLDA
jgi:hypothetical protein